MKTKRYWTLVVREDGQWAPQFGDYDREVVRDEQDDVVGHGTARKDTLVINSGDKQVEIDAAVAELNAMYAAM